MLEQAQTRDGGVPVEASEDRQEGAKVIPLFRGARGSEQPLVTLANGAWKKLDVMRRFAVSDRTVERWQKHEGLPHEKPFGARGPVRYDPAKVEAWWTAKCYRQRSYSAGAGFLFVHVMMGLLG